MVHRNRKTKGNKRGRYCVNGNWEIATNLPYDPGLNIMQDLTIQGWKVTFLSVVIGAIGEITPCMTNEIREALGFDTATTLDCIERMQRSVVLGTSRIIKNHLAEG